MPATYYMSTCVHEAGHAVAYCHFGLGVEHLTVSKAGRGRCHQTRGTFDTSDDEAVKREIVCTLAGGFAEALYLGKSPISLLLSWRARGDHKIIGHYLDRHTEIYWHKDAIQENDIRYLTLLDECVSTAERFLSEPAVWEQVLAVAAVLSVSGKIDGKHPLLKVGS